jgi:hypothetical protein
VTEAPTSQLPHLDKLRFAVGTADGPRSAWWFVQVEDKGDVYVSVRSLGGHIKLSLHRIDQNPALDRFCQFGFTDKYISILARAGLPTPAPKYFFRWRRPLSPPCGALHVASIIIPTDFLNHNPPPIPARHKKIPFPPILFAPAPTGHAVEFLLFYSLRSASSLEKKFQQIGNPLVYNKFANGETVHFICRQAPFDTVGFHAHWNKTAPRWLSGALDDLKSAASVSGLTAIIANDPSLDGHIRLWEVSNVTFTKT